MDLYQELEKRGLLDLPNDQAAAIAGSITKTDIATADVRTLWRIQLAWYASTPTKMAGSIQAGLDDGTITGDLAEALGEMFSSLFGGSATVLQTYNSSDIAARIKQAGDGLLALQVLTLTDYEDFFALGGGFAFPGCSADQVQEAKDAKAAADAAAAAEQARLQAEVALRHKWDDAMATAGAEEAFYNGDEAALIVAINSALATMG